MSRSLRRGVLAATVLSLSIATLSACGAGNDAQTLEVKPDNAATSVGDIKIQNANVITQPEVDAKGPAVISATVFNSGLKDQKLTAISVNGSGQTAKLAPADHGSGPITVPAGGSVVIGGEGNPSAVLASGREAVQDGNAQPLTFKFSSTGQVRINAYVVPAKNYFEGYGPSQLPSPSSSPSPSGSGKPSGKPSGSASPSGSGKPTTAADHAED
ncbi:copper chaperone PCu(A)C [Streptomyces sp. RPA4-5]|uniref:copper chaperone PCu(A)C n=1 Tax=Streptomyces sp. RPA4-5 TaxID=2721245 RepID=UPI00143E4838|nr:copper chaperone PCu(A)C [Streptomyces sp. RPA4-5]QIY57028.1 copper chaperone PCu(A)C [Streptomyces sp. RPA4-5]